MYIRVVFCLHVGNILFYIDFRTLFYLAVRGLQFLREVFLIILQLMKNCVHESLVAFDPKEHHIVMMLEKYWFITKLA